VTAYDALAAVHEWLLPDELLEPEGAAGAFGALLADVPAGGRVLDCACGTGQLAVGLALRGRRVTATDASPGMVARAAGLARGRGVAVATDVCAWEELPARGWEEAFDAVLCVGNSLTHAPGRAARRTALAAMASVLRRGGDLVVTSRNWELVLARPPGLDVDDRVVVRHGRTGLVVRAWTLPGAWDAPHALDVGVALLGDDGSVATTAERLAFWPFRHAELLDDLGATGLALREDTYDPGAGRWAVVARRPA
jgi:SAM-dependent methyltransferase